jgi:hypothetical protein
MEITTILPARQVIIASQRAAAMASRQPRRSRRAIRVVLTRVERGALHYEARIARRQIRTVTVRFTQDPEVSRCLRSAASPADTRRRSGSRLLAGGVGTARPVQAVPGPDVRTAAGDLRSGRQPTLT